MASKTSVVNYLNGQQINDYMGELKKNDCLFNFIRESFRSKMDITQGVNKDDMHRVVNAATDLDLKNALKGVILVGDNKTIFTLDNTERSNYRKALVVYGKRTDEKYDILIVYATQVKELAVDKLIACGLGSVCAGILAGVLTMNPGVGIGTAVVFSTASVAKATLDCTQEMPDVLCGYILEELVQKQVLRIQPNGIVQFAITS